MKSFSVFSGAIRRVGAIAGLALAIAGGIPAAADAGVVSIDLTGFTGVGGGTPLGGQRIISPFAIENMLVINNNLNPAGGVIITGLYMDYTGGIAAGDTSASPINFSAGASIDSNAGGGSYKTDLESYFEVLGVKAPVFGPNNYLGFKTKGGQYGYIEVTWDGAGTFSLISAAYESTPGKAILAGAQPGNGGEVPEPASAAIAALLIGGTALRQWRSKRSEVNDDALAS